MSHTGSNAGPGRAAADDRVDHLEGLRTRLDRLHSQDHDGRMDRQKAVAGAARDLIDHLIATAAPSDVLADVEALLMRATASLRGHRGNRQLQPSASEEPGYGSDHLYWSPMTGLANPLAPPLDLSIEDGVVVGTGKYGAGYGGPPGCVHGGHIAAAFDEILGVVQALSGRMGLTGTLTVRYHSPTPLHTELRFEGRCDGLNGRKILTSAVALVDGVVTAEATCVFVAMTTPRDA
jgi:acyl-coenzyme A thioesterase PaaI-like protein